MTALGRRAERDDDCALGLACLGLYGSAALLRGMKESGPRSAWWASEARLAGWGVGPAAARALVEARQGLDFAEAKRRLHRAGQWFVPYMSPLYPIELRQLESPPAGLFVRGCKEVLGKFSGVPRMTVVGTRRATAEGTLATRSFAAALSRHGIAIISGMALGIDSCAHSTALDEAGLTMAVLGCGVDVAYPPRLRWLHEKIGGNGAVVSEFPPGCPPTKWTFPQRNRLLAALGDAVLVVEGSNTSGALQTAKWALELGRQVFSVPGSIFKETSEGCNALIYDGAIPALRPERVVEEFLKVTRMQRGGRDVAATSRAAAGEQMGLPGVVAVDRPSGRVMEALAVGPASADGLVRETGLTPREVGAALGELEICGQVVRAGPGLFARAP